MYIFPVNDWTIEYYWNRISPLPVVKRKASEASFWVRYVKEETLNITIENIMVLINILLVKGWNVNVEGYAYYCTTIH